MQSLLVSHTHRYHRHHNSGGHVWQGRFKSPVIQNDDHLLTVLRYIEANPVSAGIVEHAGDYEWSSFADHGLGSPMDLLDPVLPYEQMAKDADTRRKKWHKYVHQRPSKKELQEIRRSIETGLPYGTASWIKALSRKVKLDLTIRPRGRPRKASSGYKGRKQ